MITLTLTAGQISRDVEVGPGARITTVGSGKVQYLAGTLSDARNGNGTWVDWPLGSTAGSVDTIRRMTIRGVATGALTVTIDEEKKDPSPDGAFWDSQIPAWNADNTGLVLPDGTELLLPSRLDASIPSPDYHVALRGGQTGYSSYTDQSSNANDATINTALFPAAWTASAALALGVYKSPTTLNGNLYKVTTAGTTGATEPTWPTTIGGTVVDGTVTWTCEKGPWYIDTTTGLRHFRSIASAQLGGVDGSFSMPAIDWDLAAGDSLIINIHGAFDFTAADDVTVISNRVSGGSGFNILATASATFKDFKIYVLGGGVTVNSGHVKSTFARKPLNGAEHTTTFMIDGQTKIMYCFGDGVAYTQSDMFNSSNLSPNNLNLAAITGSTLSTNPVTIGKLVGATTTYEIGMMHFDVLVGKGKSLPADIQGVANWFHQRGLGLIPYGVLQW